MLVAYTLGKTLDEISGMTLEEVSYWLAFFNVYRKREEHAMNDATRRGRR